MILYITRGTSRIALRVKELNQNSQVISWEHLQLLIEPGQWDVDCGPNGSPWFLYGCWPGKLVGVDVANPPQHDFPALIYPAFALDCAGRVVFRLDERLHSLPNGRYTGTLRTIPHVAPFRMTPIVMPKPEEHDIPEEYIIGRDCLPDTPPHPPMPPKPKCCILARFDIDLGPECSEHYIDQVTVDMYDGCGVDDGNS